MRILRLRVSGTTYRRIHGTCALHRWMIETFVKCRREDRKLKCWILCCWKCKLTDRRCFHSNANQIIADQEFSPVNNLIAISVHKRHLPIAVHLARIKLRVAGWRTIFFVLTGTRNLFDERERCSRSCMTRISMCQQRQRLRNRH